MKQGGKVFLLVTAINGRVAPHAGAWIETNTAGMDGYCRRDESPPTRGRGLKPLSNLMNSGHRLTRRPPRGGVD